MNRLFINIINKLKQIYPARMNEVGPIVPPRMGRWNIDYCKTKTDIKIDLANIDHCGPCGLANKQPSNTVNILT